MSYSLTIFRNAFDNKCHRRMDFQSWEDFVDLLRGLSTQPLKDKKSAQLISAATYEIGTTRANRNVIDWGHWACVDVDDYTGTMNDLLTRFESTDTVVYSTASSTIEHPKFRVLC